MRRILVVDDDLSICRALQLGLSSREVEVDFADDGKSGVELGYRKQYDVVITDMILPGIDGLEVIKGVRTNCPDVVSILISGSPGDNIVAQALRNGVTYLEKPLDLKTVKEAVNRGLKEQALKRRSTRASITSL